MKLSRIGRISMALVASVALGLGMTACGGGTIGFMWVLGAQYNQIAGFEIDNFSGNLTAAPHSPFNSGGTDPVFLVVKGGGRFLYVINRGSGLIPDANGVVSCQAGQGGGSIVEFSVGGQAVLTSQQTFQSQGCTPVWAAQGNGGANLYVLDQYAPGAKCLANGQAAPPSPPNFCNGEITVFSADPNTGRLTLVLNQQIKDPTTQLQLTYFPVGSLPSMLTFAGSCLFTLDSGDQTVFPYASGSNGQLTLTTNSTINTQATRATSINGNGTSVYITDAGGAPGTNLPGQVLPFTVGASSCSLNTVTGGATQNILQATNPVYSLVDSKGLRLYLANQTSTNTNVSFSSISGFNIQPDNKLLSIPGNGNPYPVGAGPVCMVEDPSNQYIYTSNGDGTVSGKSIFTDGTLSNLTRGSTFNAVGQATCLAVSGSID